MVTPSEVLHQIFLECDRDNDGIVWLSELQQLALNHSTDVKELEQPCIDEENVPLNFEEFCQRFAGQIRESCNGEINNTNMTSAYLLDGVIDADDIDDDDDVEVDGGEKNVVKDLPLLKNNDKIIEHAGTSSGVSDCSGDFDLPECTADVNTDEMYVKRVEDGFEGYGELSSENLENQLNDEIMSKPSPTISPSASFQRRNSPFRLSSRRLKRGSMPPSLQPDITDSTLEEDMMRQKLEDLDRKLAGVEFELKAERENTLKLNNDKRELKNKIINLEEGLRETELSFKKKEKDHTTLVQGLNDKIHWTKQSCEAEKTAQMNQISTYEEELAHSHQVKQTLTDEVMKLRDVWAMSQEREAMWETRYHEAVQTQAQREVELEVLTLSRVKEREGHIMDMKVLQSKMNELVDQIEEMNARKRSDTIVGRLQGKVERVQAENQQLKEMTETFLSRDIGSTLALELSSASQEEIHEAYNTMQKDYDKLQKYVDKLLMNIISEAPHLLCVDTSRK